MGLEVHSLVWLLQESGEYGGKDQPLGSRGLEWGAQMCPLRAVGPWADHSASLSLCATLPVVLGYTRGGRSLHCL